MAYAACPSLLVVFVVACVLNLAILFLPFLEAVFIGGNGGLARQIFANQGGFFDACQEGKLEKVDEEWQKSDRQGDIESYEHSFSVS